MASETGDSAETTTTYAALEPAGATQEFAVLTLDGTAQPWNITGAPGREDDVQLVVAALDAAASESCVDVSSTVIVGYGSAPGREVVSRHGEGVDVFLTAATFHISAGPAAMRVACASFRPPLAA